MLISTTKPHLNLKQRALCGCKLNIYMSVSTKAMCLSDVNSFGLVLYVLVDFWYQLH